MKTLVLLFTALVNAAFLAVAAMAAATVDVPSVGRALAAAIALALGAALALLLLARLDKVPAHGVDAMRYLCIGVPVLWFAGSLDHGEISGPEWVFLIVVCLVTWGTWHVFKFLRSPA
jgi:hypothetical protein